jgi:hypothetical protein
VPDPTIAEQILKAIQMLTIEVRANTAALAKPHARRPSLAERWRKVEADYLAQQERKKL